MLDKTTLAPSGTRRRRSMLSMLSMFFAVALLGGVLASCTTTPQAVMNVPGNYVADLWAPTLNGGAAATVLMCLDEPSAVLLQTGDGGEGSVGSITLNWAGTTYQVSDFDAVTLTTPILQLGCGTLTFGVDCCHVDHYLAIKATKV
jgi:hypothetical protein